MAARVCGVDPTLNVNPLMFALHNTNKTSFVSDKFVKPQTLVCAVDVGSSPSSCASSSTVAEAANTLHYMNGLFIRKK